MSGRGLHLRLLMAVVVLLVSGRATPGQPAAPPEATFRGKAAAEWVETVRKGDAAARAEAVTALRELGPKAGAAAVPVLIEALEDEETRVRVGALQTLGKFGPAAKAAVPALIQALDDLDPAYRATAAEALAAIGPDARAAIPQLRTLLETKDPKAQSVMIRALAAVTPPDEVVSSLVKLGGPEAPMIVRIEVIQALGQAKGGGEQVMPLLAAGLREKHFSFQRAAGEAFFKRGAESVPTLVRLLAEGSDVGTRAATLLKSLGPTAKSAGPELVRLIKEKPQSSSALPGVLAAVGATETVPALVDIVKGKDVEAAALAADALGKLGSGANAAASALVEALRSDNRRLAVLAGNALTQLGADVVVPELAKALKDGNEPVYYMVRQLGPKAKGAVPALIEVARKNDDPARRQRAIHLLGELGPTAKEAAPALLELLDDKDPLVRDQARRALVKIGPAK